MTRPRIVIEGATLAISRRTTRRYYLFNPDASRQVEEAFWYCLGHAAERYGVLVHAACLMSTHTHAVITDVRGELPRFLEAFHRNFACFIKAYRGWPEEVFNKQSTSAHWLLSPKAIVESMGYLICNPVAAFAARYAKDWPGATTLPSDVGRRTIRVKRPAHYFDPNNPEWPQHIELRLTMPVALELDYGKELVKERLWAVVKRREHQAWNEAKQKGIGFVGAKRIVKLPHTKRANSHEAFGSLDPQFSAAGDRALAKEAVKRIRAFYAQYNRALRAWHAGDRDVCFPKGTWWMRVFHGVRCAQGP